MVAYAPYDAPPKDQVVVATIVEACNPWEWWAPYATNIVIQGIFGKQTYEEAIKELKKSSNRIYRVEYKAVINIDGFNIRLAKLEGNPTVDNIEDMLDSWLDAVKDLEDRL